jgi:hypothetical protein
VQSLSKAVAEVEASPERIAEKERLADAKQTIRDIREVLGEPPVHSGLTVKQRLRVQEQKKKALHGGKTKFRGRTIGVGTPQQQQEAAAKECDDMSVVSAMSSLGLGGDDGEITTTKNEKAFTKKDLRRALSPSRIYRDKVFYHDPPEPERLFHWENHTVKMKAVEQNGELHFSDVRTPKGWKNRLNYFTEHHHIGGKRDDRQLFLECNGAGGESFIMVDGIPTNPNKNHRAMPAGTAVAVSDMLQTTPLPADVTQSLIPSHERAATTVVRKGVFDDTWKWGDN